MGFSPRLEMALEGCAGEFLGLKIDQASPKVGPAGPKGGPNSPKGGPTGGKVGESDRFENSFKAKGWPYI